MNTLEMTRIKNLKTGMTNGGWCYDSHPYLESLDAKKTIEIATIEGPAVIKCIHIVKHEITDFLGKRRKYVPRGIVLLIYYNDKKNPAVEVPLADFFCDGLNGKTDCFSNIFFENGPGSYNCYIEMPFEKSCRICLRNDTPFNIMSYSYVEYEELEKWDSSLGYFHATYNRIPFKLKEDTLLELFKLEGCSGHILGRQLSISTNERIFSGFTYIMEGNTEIRIDTNDASIHQGLYKMGEGPDYDYLGTECFFGCAWGWSKYIGNKLGCTYYESLDLFKLLRKDFSAHSRNYKIGEDYSSDINETVKRVLLSLKDLRKKNTLSQLSTYRFFYPNVIRFSQSIDWRINWIHEFSHDSFRPYKDMLKDIAKDKRRLNVDFAEVMYWYQNIIGYDHAKLPTYENRI